MTRDHERDCEHSRNGDDTSSRCAPRPKINPDRLWGDLMELGKIGSSEHAGARGVSRLAFTPADMEGRRWLLEKMRSAGLRAWMDSAGNVFGRLEGAIAVPQEGPLPDPQSGPAILLGSHIDTVPEGGMFDGTLGVLGALECARAIRDSGVRLNHPLCVVAFSNEEGSRIIPGTFGSRTFSVGITEAEWKRVLPALAEAGLGAPQPPEPSSRPEDYLCYLELHIEQGGVLYRSGEDIGVVQGIVWISAFNVVFQGEANHAGTTPMDQRKDALLGASEFVLAVPEIVQRLGSGRSVGTCGRLTVSPGGRNVIPGRADVSVEVRDLDEGVVLRLVDAVKGAARNIAARRGLNVEVSEASVISGARMDPRIQDAIERAANALGLKVRRMPSGAGHDAMNLAKRVPTGMIFVPSIGGISHSPAEYTPKESCAAGAQVMLDTVLAIDAGALAASSQGA